MLDRLVKSRTLRVLAGALSLAAGGCLLLACDSGEDASLPAIRIADIDVGFEDFGADVSVDVDAAPDVPQVFELRAVAEAPTYSIVDHPVVLDGSRSTGAVSFRWDFGDGRGWDEPREEASTTVSYTEPGRYEAVLTAYGPDGSADSATTLISVTEQPIYVPRQSSTVAIFPGTTRFAVVSPDSDEVAVIRKDRGTEEQFSLVRRLPTDDGPRTLAPYEEWVVVACEGDDTVLFMLHDNSGEVRRVFFPQGSRPYGVVATTDGVFVTLRGTGELTRIEFQQGVPRVTQTVEVIDDARDLALLPDGRIVVSRWRSPDERAELAVVAPDLSDVNVWTLPREEPSASSGDFGGVPSYLGPPAVSPIGGIAAVPSLRANIGRGLFSDGEPLTPETTVRAITSFVDLETGEEVAERRLRFDGRGLANVAIFSPRGDYLYVAMAGGRAIERYDMLESAHAGTIEEVGFAPRGLAVSPDNRFLFVDAYLSRKLVIYDVRELSAGLQPVAEFDIPGEEPLDPQILRGKQLFHDAGDPRLSSGHIACGHCHLEGLSDHRTWDFTQLGEGLRNTISLVGRGGGKGPLLWAGSFDEVQDVEHFIRGFSGGTGLMTDAEFTTGTRNEPLGDSKAGISADLDALAAYVESLTEPLPSPHLDSRGMLTMEAATGKTIFESAETGCAGCHSGPRLTDSQFLADGTPLLHDVGTLTPASGMRSGGPLPGLDTPSLRGLSHSAPYLHDGSAPTLRDVLVTRNLADEHGKTSQLRDEEIDQLVAYLLSL